MKLMGALAAATAVLPALVAAAPTPGRTDATRREWGPDHLQEICADGVCHRFGKVNAPLDHADPAPGQHEIACHSSIKQLIEL